MSKTLKTKIRCDCGGLLNYRTVGDMSGDVELGNSIVTVVWCGKCHEKRKHGVVKDYERQFNLF